MLSSASSSNKKTNVASSEFKYVVSGYISGTIRVADRNAASSVDYYKTILAAFRQIPLKVYTKACVAAVTGEVTKELAANARFGQTRMVSGMCYGYDLAKTSFSKVVEMGSFGPVVDTSEVLRLSVCSPKVAAAAYEVHIVIKSAEAAVPVDIDSAHIKATIKALYGLKSIKELKVKTQAK